ncbi:MAG TPA: SigE family RNA polymerase sigma factor [Mycobacteriales bacterium]|nr:SigE family RNA polymerase sigma factor [Mycobacteriales bacterium]
MDTERTSRSAPSLTPPAGRDAALTELFVAYHRRLVGLARLLVDDVPTAEDVVQDAFLSLYRRWPWLRDATSALPYLQTSVVNGARSTLRRRRTVRQTFLPASLEGLSAEETVVTAADRDALVVGLRQLSRRQRQVLVLRYYLDLSEAEISDSLSISKGSVKTHTSRGLAALAAQLEPVR